MASFVQSAPFFFSILIVIQLPILYAIVHLAYIGPIQKLNQSIARFYTGTDDEPDIKAKAWSK